jgi:parvulin-like peptidyl-prolyl isomerase
VRLTALALIAAQFALPGASQGDNVVARTPWGDVTETDVVMFRQQMPGPDVRGVVIAEASTAEVARSIALEAGLAQPARSDGASLENSPETPLFRERARARCLAYIDSLASSEVSVDAASVEALAEELAHRRTAPAMVQFQHLFRALGPEPDERDRAEQTAILERARAEVEAGIDFATVAARHSEAERWTGITGPVALDQLPEQLQRVIEPLGEGEWSPVFRSGPGLNLIRLTRRFPARTPAHSEMVSLAREQLREARGEELIAQRAEAWATSLGLETDLSPLLSGPQDHLQTAVVTLGDHVTTIADVLAFLGAARDTDDLRAFSESTWRGAIDSLIQNQWLETVHPNLPTLGKRLAWLDNRLLIRAWRSRLIAMATFDYEELRTHIAAHPEPFTREPLLEVEAVVVPLPASPELEERERQRLARRAAERAAARLSSGESAAEVAAAFGGRVERPAQPLRPGPQGPRFDLALWSLGEGEVSTPLPVRQGVAVFRVLRKIPRPGAPPESQLALARERMASEAAERTFAEAVAETLDKVQLVP